MAELDDMDGMGDTMEGGEGFTIVLPVSTYVFDAWPPILSWPNVPDLTSALLTLGPLTAVEGVTGAPGTATWNCASLGPVSALSGSVVMTVNGQPVTLPIVVTIADPVTVTTPTSAPAASHPLTIQGILQHLVGLDNWLAAAAASRAQYDDKKIMANVPSVLRQFERETLIALTPKQVITRNDGTYAPASATPGATTIANNGLPVKWEEAYTYYPDDAAEYFAIALKTRPVQSVQRCRIAFGNLNILELPPVWYEIDRHSGKFQIIPVNGALYATSFNTGYALLQEGFGNRSYVPHSVQFDYVAGLRGIEKDTDGNVTYAGWWNDDEYADTLRIIEEYVALQILNDIAHLPDAGLSGKSISGGGSGESYNYTRFMDRKAELQADIDKFTGVFAAQESSLLFGGV